jgi:hypothetical protein
MYKHDLPWWVNELVNVAKFRAFLSPDGDENAFNVGNPMP